jgi:hypothetical protein
MWFRGAASYGREFAVRESLGMHPGRVVLIALVAATWLAIAGAGLLLRAVLEPGPNPGLDMFGTVSFGVAALMTGLAIRSRPP